MSIDIKKSYSPDRVQLPRIVHRMPKYEAMSLQNTPRGITSRASSIGDLSVKNLGLAESADFNRPIRVDEGAFALRAQKQRRTSESPLNNSTNNKIPDHVRAVYTADPNKVSIPVFGSRPGTSYSQAFQSQSLLSFSQLDNQQQQLKMPPSLDEYMAVLKEKIRCNPFEIRAKFRNVDIDHGTKGISREALAHIIASVLGPTKPLSHQTFLKLLDKLGLKDFPVIRYEEFVSSLHEKVNSPNESEWLDSSRTNNSTFHLPVNRKANQVFVILKEKAKIRSTDMVRLIPLLNGGIAGRIFKHELYTTVTAMGIKIESEEFEKLWKKFDTENLGYVKSEAFLKKLGLGSLVEESLDSVIADFNEDAKFNVPQANLPEERLANKYGDVAVGKKASISKRNPIDRWLKKRFRDGFYKIRASFEEIDIQKTGQVRRDQFLKVLRQHNLSLEDTLLDAFLDRCGLKIPNHSTLISYKDFLEKFQSRSDSGIAYRFIRNGDFQEDRPLSKVGQIEKRLIKAFQSDFLGLLQTFRKIDRKKENAISKQEFRAALESHFGIELNDEEFEKLMREVPCDNLNRVQYLEYMTRFDSDTSTSSLFDAQSVKDEDFQPRLAKKPDYDTILEENENFEFLEKPAYNGRSLTQLRMLIKDKVRNEYKSVESAWNEVDTLNSNEMTKDMMYETFKKLKFSPTITREEIDLLWNEFILKDNKKLEYFQFVRHFGYSRNSACYQNAKLAPPKRGDTDVMLLSNKLGRDSILIRGSVQSKIIMQFDNLKHSFEEIDPYKTNLLLRDEFEEILKELCPELNKQEMDFICSKYDTSKDGRINYMEFLIPYNPKKYQKVSTSDRLNQTENLPSSRLDMNDSLIIKLRIKLTEHYKELRRIFKQHDFKQTGFVPISSFKETISAKVKLNEDEMYDLLRRLDKDVTGTINYNKFINEIIKP